jgi:adenylylsulfate kinase-like enzyme
MESKFRKATRQKLKAAIMIEGLQGSGKSGLALTLARALSSDWDKIYAIDTENKSLDLFQGIKMNTGEVFSEFNKVDLTAEDFKEFAVSGTLPCIK